jgi:hypothetical protein
MVRIQQPGEAVLRLILPEDRLEAGAQTPPEPANGRLLPRGSTLDGVQVQTRIKQG